VRAKGTDEAAHCRNLQTYSSALPEGLVGQSNTEYLLQYVTQSE